MQSNNGKISLIKEACSVFSTQVSLLKDYPNIRASISEFLNNIESLFQQGLFKEASEFLTNFFKYLQKGSPQSVISNKDFIEQQIGFHLRNCLSALDSSKHGLKKDDPVLKELNDLENLILETLTFTYSFCSCEKAESRTWGFKELVIRNVQLLRKNVESVIFHTGDALKIKIDYYAKDKIDNPVIGFAIHSYDGVLIFGANNNHIKKKIGSLQGEGEMIFKINKLPMLTGTYFLSVAAYDDAISYPFNHHYKKYIFNIISEKDAPSGIIDLKFSLN